MLARAEVGLDVTLRPLPFTLVLLIRAEDLDTPDHIEQQPLDRRAIGRINSHPANWTDSIGTTRIMQTSLAKGVLTGSDHGLE